MEDAEINSKSNFFIVLKVGISSECKKMFSDIRKTINDIYETTERGGACGKSSADAEAALGNILLSGARAASERTRNSLAGAGCS